MKTKAAHFTVCSRIPFGRRGVALEMLIAKLLFTARSLQLVAMTATIGNIPDICRFLNARLYHGTYCALTVLGYKKGARTSLP